MPFRDYQASNGFELFQKLLEVEITEEQRSAEIYWSKTYLNKPFFESPTSDTGEIEKADAVHRRHKDACYRAGLPNAPNFHDFRREGLSNAGMYMISFTYTSCWSVTYRYKIRTTQNRPACDSGAK